ncbi:hypothetical protein SRS16CHR_04300 [Variovorax sp. SRS16]|uniref:hypothetical protein n=1 Tax=Variovorax sp. SRS16 TaxID=282217 RepID=UPI00131636FF|nr:hypothetical protein [Variovorax sp. SRS16]VTU28608.1 hypothetical protein SRS16CHR_04300 [Variovorax sp. SRS16]
MDGISVSLQLLQRAVDAVEQTMHHVLRSEPDVHFTSPTDLLSLSPAEEERVRNEETTSNLKRPELAAIQFCLMSSMAMLAVCHSLFEEPSDQTPFDRERKWKKLASDAKTAGRTAYRAALVLSDPASRGE